MAKFVKGDVVVIPFPFSDLSQAKRRPALVLAVLQGNDLILCQITSKSVKDNYSIPVDPNDFASGSLNQESNIRPNKLFTVDSQIILYGACSIKKPKFDQVIDKIIEIIK